MRFEGMTVKVEVPIRPVLISRVVRLDRYLHFRLQADHQETILLHRVRVHPLLPQCRAKESLHQPPRKLERFRDWIQIYHLDPFRHHQTVESEVCLQGANQGHRRWLLNHPNYHLTGDRMITFRAQGPNPLPRKIRTKIIYTKY